MEVIQTELAAKKSQTTDCLPSFRLFLPNQELIWSTCQYVRTETIAQFIN